MCEKKLDMTEKEKFYRDLLYKMMGFGLAVLLLVSGWLIDTEDNPKFSFENPNKVATKAALMEGNTGSTEYEKEYKKVFTAADMRKDRAWGLVIILPTGSLLWVLSVYAVWLKCRKKEAVPHGVIVAIYCIILILPQVIYFYLIFRD
jgi:hypothetical protein